VYRGLLIDDGLHIDPGYHGPIYVPIHNFTDQERTLLQGQPFLSVEFSRTTPLPAAPLERIRVEAELVGAYGKKGLDGYEGHGVILFNKDLEGLRRPPRTPRHFWNKFPAEQHKSAMIGTEDRLKALGDDVTERLRKSERNVSDQLRRSERIGYVGLLVSVT
jgi:hypothetical protein